MSLFLHICTGLGLALAAGIRPFTPAWLAGALAGSNVLFDFKGHRLRLPPVAVVPFGGGVGLRGVRDVETTCVRELVATAGIALGGLLFAAILAAHHDAAWPGLIGGVLAGALAQLASRPVLSGASERLSDGAARFAVFLYADAAALVLAAACWFAGPLALVALAFLGRLAWAQRNRASARFAGLRVLR